MSKKIIPWEGALPELASNMTLRDYFAAALLQGNLKQFDQSHDPSLVAARIYDYADIMIAERDRKRTQP